MDHARWFSNEVQPHGAALRSYLQSRFPTLPDVENLVQESLVRVLRTHENGRVESPKALLFVTARNLALDVMRRQRLVSFEPITEVPGSSVFTDDADVVESVCRRQESEILIEAIKSLPERCRQVMTLRMVYRLSQKEIAARLCVTENTVEKQMGNGIRRCWEYFGRLGLP